MRRLPWFVCSFVLSGCFFPADRGRVLEARIESVGTETQKVQEALRQAEQKLEQTAARLQEALDKLDSASRTTGANIGVKVDSTIQDVAMLRGLLESIQNKQQELDRQLAAQPATSSGKPESEPKKDEFKKPEDPKEFLKLAEEKAKGGENAIARRLFNEYLKKWPREDPSEAEYGLGETLASEDDCTQALYYYGRVIQAAKSKLAPTALVRSSDCFKKLKMIAEAKLALETLAKDYPKSEAAKQVKAKLAELNKAAPKPAPKAKK